MASNYSANQYENAFHSSRLQQWTVPETHKSRHPDSRLGSTQPITNDRGHILNEKKRSGSSPWSDFRGTWQMTKDDMVKTVPR